mmetsp:Transcript_9301/g.30793  ORF Transcript_9301/g.30793 Transcript_9301/m.30793 type:complete len:201 (+) Transcript_9301:108-710(+)
MWHLSQPNWILRRRMLGAAAPPRWLRHPPHACQQQRSHGWCDATSTSLDARRSHCRRRLRRCRCRLRALVRHRVCCGRSAAATRSCAPRNASHSLCRRRCSLLRPRCRTVHGRTGGDSRGVRSRAGRTRHRGTRARHTGPACPARLIAGAPRGAASARGAARRGFGGRSCGSDQCCGDRGGDGGTPHRPRMLGGRDFMHP